MNFESHVKRVILTYPRIFPDVLRVYNHIFLTIGNGYSWEDGEIVYSAEEEFCDNKEDAVKRVLLTLCEEQKTLDSWDKETSLTECCRERYIANTARLINTIYNVDNIINDLSIKDYDKNKMKFNISEYSLISNIPDNASSEYVFLIYKFLDVLKNNMDRVEDPENLFDKIFKKVDILLIQIFKEEY